MHGGRSRGAGVFHPRRRLEAKRRIGLQDERSREILRRKAGIEMPEHNLVDIARGDAGVRQRFVRDLDDKTLDGLGVEFPEGRVRPPDNAGCHDCSPKNPRSRSDC